MIAYPIVVTKKANADEFAIYNYILTEFGKIYAEKFRSQLLQFFKTLSRYPFIGRAAKNNPTLRVYVLNKHNKLVYKVTEDKIVIVRLLLQKMKIAGRY